MRSLIAIPVYNEAAHVERVIRRVLAHTPHVLAIDDGSSDDTPAILTRFPVDVIRHGVNRGYGRSIRDAFAWAAVRRFDWVVTMDCDEQHEPDAIPVFQGAAAAAERARERGEPAPDVISGSRYLDKDAPAEGAAPADRRSINAQITRELNQRLALNLTDAFCGFKAYRVAPLERMRLNETGYAFPIQFWVQAVAARLTVTEIPVKLIYNGPNRSFGGLLDDAPTRLAHYRQVLHCELERCAHALPAAALSGIDAGCRCGST